MMHAWRKWMVLGAVLLTGTTACGNDDPTDPVVIDPGVTVSGLNFQLAGATLTSVSATLPTADASFVAPVVSVDRSPTPTAPATISVSAAEPFQTILVQPSGATSYVRIFLPVATQLIGVRVLTDAAGSATVSTAVTIAVGSGARTSRTTPLSLQPVGN